MDPQQLDDDQLDDLAAQLAPRFPTGTHGDRVVLSRRQFAAAATGTLGAGALMALGVDEASAQAAGQQGTASSPNDMFAYDLNVANSVTSSLPMNGNDIENAGSVSTEALANAGTTTTLVADPISSAASSVSFDVDTDIYDGIILIILMEGASGTSTIDLTVGSAADGDYDYTTRSGPTWAGDSGANNWPLFDSTGDGAYRVSIDFSQRAFIAYDGSGSDDISHDRQRLVGGLIDKSPSGIETINLNVADGVGRIGRVLVPGIQR